MTNTTTSVNALKLVKFLETISCNGIVEVGSPTPGTYKPDHRVCMSVAEAAKHSLGKTNRWVQLHQLKDGHRGPSQSRDIVRLKWLLVDCDPTRNGVKGCAATDEEKAAAEATANNVTEWAVGEGWPAPIRVGSGNGVQLLFPVDLPANDYGKGQLKQTLVMLNQKFGSSAVKIDPSVAKISQLGRMPCTINAKGEATPDRPHRETTVSFPAWVDKGLRPTVQLPECDAGNSELTNTVTLLDRKTISADQLDELLAEIPANEYDSNETWFRMLAASHHATGGSAEARQVFVDWCVTDPLYADQASEIEARWNSLKPDGKITIATLLKEAAKTSAGALVAQRIKAQLDFSTLPAIGVNADPMMPRIGRPEFQTDNANASLLAERVAGQLKHVRKWRNWIRWNGKKWEVDPAGVYAIAASRDLAASLWEDIGHAARVLDRSDLQRAHAFVRNANSGSRIRSVADLAKSDPLVLIEHESLNANLELFNCLNGTLDLATGDFHSHNPDDLITQVADVEYDPAAKCPLWEQQMLLTFGDDVQLRQYVQAILGSTLAGSSRDEILPIAWGDGANGKSTLWLTIKSLMGDYASIFPQELLTPDRSQHPTIKAGLFGCRFACVEELEQGRTLRESMVKSLLEGTLTTRRCGEDFWDFDRTHTLWMSTNHKPRVVNSDNGIWRRIKLIPFVKHIPTELAKRNLKQVEGFDEKLRAEKAGILNWLLEGYRLFREKGLSAIEPAAVRVATTEYRESQDLISQCLEEKFVKSPCGEVLLEKVFEIIKSNSFDLPLKSKRELKPELERRGLQIIKSKRSSTRDQQVVLGIEIRPEPIADFGDAVEQPPAAAPVAGDFGETDFGIFA